MKTDLGNIAQLQFGLYAKPNDKGEAIYLQTKHFDDWGNQSLKIDTFIPINKKSKSHLLEDGDVLFVGKGLRNFAWTYYDDFGPAIASSIFFVIKADRSKVIPEYLTTVFNLPQTQAYFQILGAGSSIPSIRKSELEAFSIQLPSMEVQEQVVATRHLHNQDIDLSHKIITEKEKRFQAVINHLIHDSHDEKNKTCST